MRYEPTTGTPYALNEYAIIPVGTAYRDGAWRELNRDLSADLQSVFGVGVETVKWFIVRGNYDLDDLVLLDNARTTKYYMFNGQRVAMNRAGVVYYVLGDHLGSTAITVDSSGAKASELRYKPYGEVRYSGLPNGTGTDYRFTGQRQLAGLGLYQMGARWVDPSLGRWLSADTLVPDPANPQGLNRYSFVLGNPLKYVDPSGHEACAADDEWRWKNRWYNAHGWWWNSETGHWDISGGIFFSDADILDEVARNAPEVLSAGRRPYLGFVLSQAERRLRIKSFALYLTGEGINSVEILSRIVEYASSFHNNAIIRPFVDDVSSVLVGHTGFDAWLDVFTRNDPGPYYVPANNFDQSGLASYYQDSNQDIGQLHHFWFYVHLAVFNGPALAVAANTQHDPPWIDDPARGMSRNDHFLGIAGIALGSALNVRVFSIFSVGNWIRQYLGQ